MAGQLVYRGIGVEPNGTDGGDVEGLGEGVVDPEHAQVTLQPRLPLGRYRVRQLRGQPTLHLNA